MPSQHFKPPATGAFNMNQKKAKRLRREVYGDMSTRGTKYYRDPKTGRIVSDKLRWTFKRLKKEAA